MTPYVLIIVLMNYNGFSVNFASKEACDAMAAKFANVVRAVSCGPTGAPIQIQVKSYTPEQGNVQKMQVTRRKVRRIRFRHYSQDRDRFWQDYSEGR